jgi:hypothetical protein
MDNIELRPLKATDMGAVCKIISAIGARQFKDCFDISNFDGKKDIKTVGFEIFFDIAGIVISNIPRAEKEIMSFVASVANKDVKELEEMPFADYGELVARIVTKDDFKDFFSQVMKLFNH